MASIINLIKQHDISSLASTDELTFVYPFVVSSAVDSKTANDLRSFMMVQYLSQIKLTNAIKVTTSLANPKKDARILKVDSNKFNPSNSSPVQLQIGNQASTPFSITNIKEDISVDLTKQEYIDRFRTVLVNLIKTEPKFSQLNPIITTLTLENLLSIPIIAASKIVDISNDVLYWIMFAAIGQRIKLNSSESLNRVEAVLRAIPKDSYSQLLDPNFIKKVEKEKDRQAKHRINMLPGIKKNGDISKYLQSLQDPLSKAFNSLDKVLSISRWDEQTGIKSSLDTTLSSASIATFGSNQAVISKSNVLFASLMSNYVVNLIHSLLNSIVSSDEVDISKLISSIAIDINKETTTLVDNLMLGMVNAIQSQSINSSESLFNLLETSCKSNAQINIVGLLTTMNDLGFSVRGDTNSLADFASSVVKVSSAMTSLTELLKGFISQIMKFNADASSNLTGINVNSDKIISSYRNSIERIILNHFKIPGIFDNLNNIDSARFKLLTGRFNASKFVNTISTALSEITQFMALYTFYSYFCEYTGELASEVEVKRQGVMAFPNYCLVIPIELIRPIYAVLASRSFGNLINNPDSFDNDIQTAGRVADFKLISTISDKLEIPNIIVMDGTKVYYKWMFSSSVQRITKSTLSGYVKTQTEFLKAY